MADGDIKQKVPYPKGPAYTSLDPIKIFHLTQAAGFLALLFVTSLINMPSMETDLSFLIVRLCALLLAPRSLLWCRQKWFVRRCARPRLWCGLLPPKVIKS